MYNIENLLNGIQEIKDSCAKMLLNCRKEIEGQINYIDKVLMDIQEPKRKKRYSDYIKPSFKEVEHVQVTGEEVEQLQVGSVFNLNGEAVIIDKVKGNNPRPGWRVRHTNGRIYHNLVSKSKLDLSRWLKAHNGKYTNQIIKLKIRGHKKTPNLSAVAHL